MALVTTRQYHEDWPKARSLVLTDIKRLSDGSDLRWSTVFGANNELDLATAVRNQLPLPNGGVGGINILMDAAEILVQPNVGTLVYLEAAGNRTLVRVPITDVLPGQHLLIAHKAIGGANRTLTLTGGGLPGSFRFGTTIAALSATVSGLTDYIDCVYNSITQTFDVVSYVKGF